MGIWYNPRFPFKRLDNLSPNPLLALDERNHLLRQAIYGLRMLWIVTNYYVESVVSLYLFIYLLIWCWALCLPSTDLFSKLCQE